MIQQLQKFGSFSSAPELGCVMHFIYDAKHKDTLPYWDRFPLCIPADNAPGGFLGYNLHYVSGKMRKYILDELMQNSQKKMKIDRLRANYKFLKTMSIYDDVKPCIKRYLLNHVQSRFLIIEMDNWGKVITMPTAKWAKGRPPGTRQGETQVDDNQAHQMEKDFIKHWGTEKGQSGHKGKK